VRTCSVQNTPNSERVYDKHRGFPSPENPIKFHASPSASMAAHLGPGIGVPDLHEAVVRPADDASVVPRESNGIHAVRVTRQRANLPPTHLYLMGGPGKWWGFMSGLLYQEGLTEFCLGWQKLCLAFQSRIAEIITSSSRIQRRLSCTRSDKCVFSWYKNNLLGTKTTLYDSSFWTK